MRSVQACIERMHAEQDERRIEALKRAQLARLLEWLIEMNGNA